MPTLFGMLVAGPVMPETSDRAIRSLVISHKLLGTNEWFVTVRRFGSPHQLWYGAFHGPDYPGLLSKSLKTATVDENGWRNVTEEGGSDAANFVPFLTFNNLADSVTEDVKRIKDHPLVPKDIPIYGYIYEVETGKLTEVPEATAAGSVA